MAYKFLCNISKAGLSLTKIWYLWGWATVVIRAALDQIFIKCLVKPSTFNNEFDYLSAKWRMISENPFKCSRSLRGIFRCTGCTGQPSRNPGDGPTALLSNAFYCLESPSCLVPTKEINRIRWRVIVEFFLVFWNDCWFGQDFMHVSLPPIQNAGPSWG